MNADQYLKKLRQDWRDVNASPDPNKVDRLKNIEAEGSAVKALADAFGEVDVITATERAHREKRGRR
ncbi:hypothetical protein [Micromonospora chalcea]|uniref:hypothetical protein n=1 Tax=Micromonospora chalcea TaxID=1874 RepID=UPI003D75C4C0